MQSFRCTIARSSREIAGAQRVRWQVYGEEEGLLPEGAGHGGQEVDARDHDAGTVHFLVQAGGEPVGTVRLLQASPRLGLDLESKLDLGPLAPPRPGAPSGAGIVSAEVTRYCVLRRYRHTGVTTALFLALHAESVQRGITHWVAGANMQTDCAEDAALAYRVAQAQSLMSDRFRAEPRPHPTPETPRRRPLYTEEQRSRGLSGDLSGLDLPRPLALFANRMSAQFIGPPVFDGFFNVFALPLVASLAEISARRRPLDQAA